MTPTRILITALTFAMMSPALISCGKSKQVFENSSSERIQENTSIEQIDRDTTFKIPEETSTALIQAKVDDQGNVALLVLAQTDSESVKAPTIRNLGNNTFQVDCEKEAQELFAQWKEEHKTQTITKVKTEQVMVPVERELTTWQNILLTLGWLCVGIILVFIGIVAYKIYKLR